MEIFVTSFVESLSFSTLCIREIPVVNGAQGTKFLYFYNNKLQQMNWVVLYNRCDMLLGR